MVAQKTAQKKFQIYLALHNIRSTHNVGAIFRTADAVGVERVFLSGYTPSPIDRFGRPRQDISKAALGAEMTVPWEHLGAEAGDQSGAVEIFEQLKKRKDMKDVVVCAIEQDARSIDFRKIRETIENSRPSRILLILGNEVDGVEKDLLDLCDHIIEVPMLGEKESLNVSVTAGIVLYQFI